MTANLQAINPPLTAQQPPLQPSVSTNHPGTGTKPSQHSDNSNISVRPPSVVPPVDGGGNSSIDYSKMEKLLELNYQVIHHSYSPYSSYRNPPVLRCSVK